MKTNNGGLTGAWWTKPIGGEKIVDEFRDYTPDAIDALRYAIEGRKQVFYSMPRKGGKSWLNAQLLKNYLENKMEEKFKTKYHALAWAAEDENNVFVDNAGMSYRISFRYAPDVVLRQCASDGIWNIVDAKSIQEPCRKAESKNINHETAKAIYRTGKGLDVMIAEILNECDKRYSRKCNAAKTNLL